jgi:hypothetical protein
MLSGTICADFSAGAVFPSALGPEFADLPISWEATGGLSCATPVAT